VCALDAVPAACAARARHRKPARLVFRHTGRVRRTKIERAWSASCRVNFWRRRPQSEPASGPGAVPTQQLRGAPSAPIVRARWSIPGPSRGSPDAVGRTRGGAPSAGSAHTSAGVVRWSCPCRFDAA
jgi:hypothetical protein